MSISFSRNPQPVQKSEREISEVSVPIALANGRLNPDAVGWSRHPHLHANLRGWGRRKRFEYWAISTPEIVVAFSVSHSDYRAGLNIYFLNREMGSEVTDGESRWLPGRPDMPPTSGMVPFGRVGKETAVSVTPNTQGTLLSLVGRRVRAEIQIFEEPGHESMGVVVPWSDRTFQYTRKSGGMRASGRVEVDGQEWLISPDTSWAALDYGRGRWPLHIVWNWGAGHGHTDGHEVGIQLGDKWTDGTPATENALRVNGKIEKLSHDVRWSYDTSDFSKPWRMVGPQVDLTFTPEYVRHSETKSFFPRIREDQAFGTWNGQVTSSEVGTIQVEDLFGWAEEVERFW